MLGKRSKQRGLFEADNKYLDFVGEDSFYGFLAKQRGKLFRDEEFVEIYCPDNGRPSVPPSLLATALLLQTYEKVSDEEAKERADYDLRWKVALGIEVEERPFAKSTLQMFRAQLIMKEKMQAVFIKSLEIAKKSGYLKSRKMKVVLDTSYILGRGAVKDTYNLIGDGIQQLCRALAEAEGQEIGRWVEAYQFEGYFGSSLKGEADIDWDDEKARNAFLQKIVSDAGRLMEIAQEIAERYKDTGNTSQRIAAASQLLEQLIKQDVEQNEEETKLIDGVSRDRIVSVHDPEMRHGRKSSAKRFDGHKVAIAVDEKSQLITAVEVIAGNEPDALPAMTLTVESEQNTELEVEETVGDCAYGSGNTRQEFADAERTLIAKVANHGRKDQIPKSKFKLDLETMTCTCPAGHTTSKLISSGYTTDKNGQRQRLKSFAFQSELCMKCPLRPKCVRAKTIRGRTIKVHPQEKLLQEARAFQNSPKFQPYRQMRQTAEHRLARLMQLGVRKARYFGRKKTLFQVLMAATVANLTLAATKTGQMKSKSQRKVSFLIFLEHKKHYFSEILPFLKRSVRLFRSEKWVFV